MPEQTSDDEQTLSLDWTRGRDVVAVPANVVLVQRLRDEVVLSFGHALPPIEVAEMSGEEMSRYFETNKKVPVQRIVRLALTSDAAALLANNLRAIGFSPLEEAAGGTDKEAES